MQVLLVNLLSFSYLCTLLDILGIIHTLYIIYMNKHFSLLLLIMCAVCFVQPAHADDPDEWYTLQIGAAGYYISPNGTASYIALDRTTTELADADLWRREGDNTAGYRLYNKSTGDDMVLAAPTTMKGTTGAESYPIMCKKGALPSGYTDLWVFTPSTNLLEEGWYIAEKGHTSYIMNNRNGKLAFWTGGKDAGSTFRWVSSKAERPVPEPSFTVFPTPQSGVPYRIPAIASTKSGVLIAVGDYRYSHADIGSGRIDLHIRRSFDFGKTWGEIEKPANMVGDGKCSGGNDYAGFGDPCIVADRESDRVMILSCAGYPGFWSCTRQQHQRCARWYSDDAGETWTGPVFIDNTYVFEPLDSSPLGPGQGMFFGSGKIHQSRFVKVGQYYRLYAANSVNTNNGCMNFVLYSDDFGESWQFLGGNKVSPIPPSGDEPKCEELPNGNVLITSRCSGGRNINIFKFTNMEKATGSWGSKTFSGASNNGIKASSNACNGETLVIPVVRKADGVKTWLIMQSVPTGTTRANVSIFYKDLEKTTSYSTCANLAKDWTGYHQSSLTSSGYSTMCVQGNKHIAFFYEENGKNDGYDMVYKDYTVEDITDSLYTYDLDADPAITDIPFHVNEVTPASGTVEEISTLTVTFNKPVTDCMKSVSLTADGVRGTCAFQENVLTITLDEPITAAGKYTLTIPEGAAIDADGQGSDAVTLTYRIWPKDVQPLLPATTKLADVSDHKAYALYNAHFTAYATYDENQSATALWTAGMTGDSGHALSNPEYSTPLNVADPCGAWMLVNYDGKSYLYNIGAEKFLKTGQPCTLVAEPQPVKVTAVSGGFAFVNEGGGSQDYMCASPQLNPPINKWTSSDTGSCWQFLENPNVAEDYDACIAKIDPSVTGIETVTTSPLKGEREGLFDLTGRTICRESRGIYIRGGKKVVVK